MLRSRTKSPKRSRLRERGWCSTLASMAARGRYDHGVGLRRLARSAGFGHKPTVRLIIKRDLEPLPDIIFDDPRAF